MNLPKHLYSLDIFRGIAASAVVFWHWKHFFTEGDEVPANFDHATQPMYTVFRQLYEHGHLAVPFFFQLSGFVFFWLYREKVASGACSGYRFAVLRFARLYPLHVLTLLVVVVLQFIHARLIGGFFVYPWNDAYHFALNAAFVSEWGFERGHSFNAPVWSVSIEVGLYCLFFLYCKIRIPHAIKLIAVLAASVLLLKLGLGGRRWPPAILAFFLGGVVFELVNAYLQYKTRVIDAIIMLAAVVGWLVVLAFDWLEHGLISRFYLFPITIAALVVAETNYPEVPKRAAWIGNLTYSSYLIHFPLQLVFVLCVFGLGYDEAVFQSTPTLAAFLILLFVLSLLVYHRFERPLQDMLRARLLSPRPIAPSGPHDSPSVDASASDSQLR